MAGRKHWIQADLRCLLCGRVLGRLIGPMPPAQGEQREAEGEAQATGRTLAGRPPRFAAFCPAAAGVPGVRLVGGERFRCTTCGGGVVIDEVETFSTYADGDAELEEERPRRGRPPKARRRTPAPPTWLDGLGMAG